MAHELVPKQGKLLSAFEVARRLRGEFAHVRVDEAEGRARARERADWLERANPRVFIGHHEAALQHANRLRTLCAGEVLSIEFGDTPNRCKRITVLPDERILFGYEGPDDEVASRELVDRCAQALECDVVMV